MVLLLRMNLDNTGRADSSNNATGAICFNLDNLNSWLRHVVTEDVLHVLQDAADNHDILGALDALFKELPQTAPNGLPMLIVDAGMEKQMREREAMLETLKRQPYAGSPAVM